MSTNSIGGLSFQMITQENLRTLVPQLQPLTKIAVTDFGSYIAEKGASIHTRYAGKFEAADWSPTDGYVSSDATSTDVNVVLQDLKHVTVEFSDYEASTLTMERLKGLFFAPMANAVVKSVFDQALALVDTDYTAGYSGAAADFDRKAVAGIAKNLTKKNLPQEGRAALISPDAYYQLVQDPAVAQAFSIGTTEIIRGNRLGMVHGIDFYEYNGFDNADFETGLNGVVSCREGLVIATRVPSAPTTGGGYQEVVTDPDSGFSFSFRYWFDWNKGKHKLSAAWLIGSAKGNKDALQKIKFTS